MSILEKYFGGHINIGPVTIYGFNAMHLAVNIWSKKLGQYICFHPTIRHHGVWLHWYFYISPNATPRAATYAIGPGVSRVDKIKAKLRSGTDGEFWDTLDAVHQIKKEREEGAE